jgi:hypothetical protein
MGASLHITWSPIERKTNSRGRKADRLGLERRLAEVSLDSR